MIHLSNPLTRSSQSGSHLFFLIVLSEQYARSALWGVVDGQLQIIQQSEDHAWQDDETCVSAIDHSLQELGKESENISQTLFALPSDWVDADGIVTQRKHLFQKMTKDLSLEPIGFVVTTEAMTQYLTRTAPQLNIFVVEVGISQITVALVKGGQISQTVKVGRSGESVSDLREALAHLKEHSLPAKIELYSPALSLEELNEVQQQLIGFAWKESYPFLHPPVIEVFEAVSFVDVVVKTGGLALLVAKGLLSAEGEEVTPSATGVTLDQNTASNSGEESNFRPVSAAEMGFAAAPLEPTRLTETLLGNTEEKVLPLAVAAVEKSDHDLESPPELAIEPARPHQQVPTTPELKTAVPHHTEKFSHRVSPAVFLKAHLKYILAGVVAGILLLAVFSFVAAQTLVHAKVLLTLHDKNVVKDITLILDPQVSQSDPDRLLLKATVMSQNEEGQKTANTTGTKIIGDKATGTVSIYNYTTSQKTFDAGTKLSLNKLSFTLNSAVTVASSSSSLDSSNNMLTKPGSQDVAVTATAIGEDSNIAAGSSLMIENFTKETYLALNSTALTGGSSREIQAVSPQDREQLLAALKKELLDKATQDAKASVANGQYEIPTNRIKVVTSTYSAEVGKETDTLSLNLTLQVELLQYKVADLQPLAQQLLTKELPAGYQLTTAAPQILSVPAETASTSAQVKLQTNLSAVAEPQINLDELKQQIAGKSEQEALKALRAHPAVSSVEISFTPKVLGALFHTLPRQSTKIEMLKK